MYFTVEYYCCRNSAVMNFIFALPLFQTFCFQQFLFRETCLQSLSLQTGLMHFSNSAYLQPTFLSLHSCYTSHLFRFLNLACTLILVLTQTLPFITILTSHFKIYQDTSRYDLSTCHSFQSDFSKKTDFHQCASKPLFYDFVNLPNSKFFFLKLHILKGFILL